MARFPAGVHPIPLAFLLSIGVSHSAAQVVRHPDSSKPLNDRWMWAWSQAKERKFDSGLWIGYSIMRRMPENGCVGTRFSDERRNRPTLGEIITGTEQVNIVAPD